MQARNCSLAPSSASSSADLVGRLCSGGLTSTTTTTIDCSSAARPATRSSYWPHIYTRASPLRMAKSCNWMSLPIRPRCLWTIEKNNFNQSTTKSLKSTYFSKQHHRKKTLKPKLCNLKFIYQIIIEFIWFFIYIFSSSPSINRVTISKNPNTKTNKLNTNRSFMDPKLLKW